MATIEVKRTAHQDQIVDVIAPELRSRSERAERLYAALRDRMTRKQTTWGGGLTVLDDPTT